jgi:hypothetical protein
LNRYTDNKVFVALSHGELCVFRRDMGIELQSIEFDKNKIVILISGGRWDLDCPIIRSVEEDSTRHGGGQGEIDDGENIDPISVIVLAAGKLWCAIRDRIFVVCPNSLTVEVTFSFLLFQNKRNNQSNFSIHLWLMIVIVMYLV